MRIAAPVVSIQVGGDNLWFVRSNDNVLHQVRDIAHLGHGETQVVEAIVTEYPNAAINIPDENVRIKGERENG